MARVRRQGNHRECEPVSRETFLSFTIPGKPVPCPRARVGRHGVHYPERYKQWRQDAVVEMHRQYEYEFPYWDCKVGMEVHFYGARANADIDNLLKSVLDACSGFLYLDDRQVVEIHGYRHGNSKEANPRVEVKAWRM